MQCRSVEFVAGGEVGEELIAAGEDDVVLWQHAEGSAAAAAGGEEDAAGLRDEGIALGDAGVAGFEFEAVVAVGGVQKRAEARITNEGIGEHAAMRGDFFQACFAASSASLSFAAVSSAQAWNSARRNSAFAAN